MLLTGRELEAVVILIVLHLLRLVRSPTLGDRGARVGLALDTGSVLVGANAQLGIQPVGDPILEGSTEEEAVTGIVVQVVLARPVGVGLAPIAVPPHRPCGGEGIGEVPDIHTAGEGVDGGEGIGGIRPIHRSILYEGADVLYLGVGAPALARAKLRRCPQGKVRTAEGGTGDMALIVGTCEGGIDARAVVLLREGDVLRQVDAGAEVGSDIVVGLHASLRPVPLRVLLALDARPPARGARGSVSPLGTLTELIL